MVKNIHLKTYLPVLLIILISAVVHYKTQNQFWSQKKENLFISEINLFFKHINQKINLDCTQFLEDIALGQTSKWFESLEFKIIEKQEALKGAFAYMNYKVELSNGVNMKLAQLHVVTNNRNNKISCHGKLQVE